MGLATIETGIQRPSALEQRAAQAAEQANAIQVQSDSDYEVAAVALRSIKAIDKEIEEFFKPHLKRAYDTHKGLKADENALRDPLKKALDKLGRIMGGYQAELERQRRIEAEMIAAQQKAAADAAAMELAEGLAESGDIVAAEGVLNQAAKMQPEVVCESIAPKVRGTAVVETWTYEIVDSSAIPREFLTPDLSAIGAYVRTRKGEAKIAGVRVYSETKVNARA